MRHAAAYLLLLLACRCAGQIADSTAQAATAGEDSSLATVSRLRLNSAQSDYGPIVKHGKLYFVSARNNKVGVQYTDVKNSPEITDLYAAPLRKDGTPQKAQPVQQLNSRYYEGPMTFSPGGDTIYFTGNDSKTKTLKVYASYRRNGKWSSPAPLPFCADTFSYCHPSLSPNGKTMYVSSNRNTGGDMDIFVSTLEGGGWSEPVKLPGAVNGPGNDVFPFAATEQKLYFSSDRPGGVGGLDLYYTSTEDSLRLPQLLYPPLNSQADDFGIWLDSAGNEGFLSSNRLPHYSDDIYRFSRRIPDFSDSEVPAVPNKFCYTFYEEEAMKGSDTAQSTFHWVFGDGHSAPGLSVRHCYENPGRYMIQLHVLNRQTHVVDSNVVHYELEIAEPPRLRIAVRDTVKAGEPVLFDSNGSSLAHHEIIRRYWSFGDGFYNKGEQAKHRYRRPGRYVAELWVETRSRKDSSITRFRQSRVITVLE